MKKFIFYFLIAISFILFIVITTYRNKISNDKWKYEITFTGTIQDVVHIKNDKGSFFKINNKWYGLSYNRIFEEKNFVGLKIEKRLNEEGIWIEKSKDSDSLLFYWSHGNIVKDSRKLMILNKNSKAPN
jgi:hypothetical protein